MTLLFSFLAMSMLLAALPVLAQAPQPDRQPLQKFPTPPPVSERPENSVIGP